MASKRRRNATTKDLHGDEDVSAKARCPLCNHRSRTFTCEDCVNDGKAVRRSQRGVDRALFLGQTELSRRWTRRKNLADMSGDIVAKIKASYEKLMKTADASLKEKKDKWQHDIHQNEALRPKNEAEFARTILLTDTKLLLQKKKEKISRLKKQLEHAKGQLDLETAKLLSLETVVLQRRERVKAYPPKEKWQGKVDEASKVASKCQQGLQDLHSKHVDLRRQHIREVIHLFRITPTSVLGSSLPTTGSFFGSMLDHSLATKFGLGILVHSVNLIATYLDIDLPHAIPSNVFSELPVRTRNEEVQDQWKEEFRAKLQLLNYNILYLFHRDGMDVTRLQPSKGQEFQTLPSLAMCCNPSRNNTLGTHANQGVLIDLSELLSEPLEEFVLIE